MQRSPEETGDYVRSLRATAEAAHAGRGQLTHWLDAHVSATAGRRSDIVLAVYEAVANAVEHAYRVQGLSGDIGVHATYDGAAGALDITVHDSGTWRPPQPTTHRGRGIALMTALSDAVTTSTGDEGTTVVLHWQLRS